MIAPCNYFRNRQKCYGFDYEPDRIPKQPKEDLIYTEWDNVCKNLVKLDFYKIVDDKNYRCSICGKKATYQASYPEKYLYKIRKIFVCERHRKMPFACISPNIPSLLAPCQLLKNPTDCSDFQ